MRAVILQPSYIPWRGYFDLIRRADVFVFYDDVQYDKHGWRNRNRIKTPGRLHWLTIPVHHKGNVNEHTPINQIRIQWERPWNKAHWNTLTQFYRKAPFFDACRPLLEPFYRQQPELLADFTIETTIALARALGIQHTRFLRSSQLGVQGAKTDRLTAILAQIGADTYLSGPAAKNYIEDEKFARAGIQLEYIVYDYPEYPQLYPPYAAQVSILDLLLMTGPQALAYLEGARIEAGNA
jgi:hypothetical protein